MSDHGTENNGFLRDFIRRCYSRGRAYSAGIRQWGRSHPRLWRSFWLLILLGGIALFVWAILPGSNENVRRGRFHGAPQPVGVAKAVSGDIRVTLNALGTVTPLATVTVRPQVTGVLTRIDFKEGQLVKAGDLLAQIDPRSFQAALDQAKGQLARDAASLANARVDLKRQQALYAVQATSQQALATQAALVRSDEGTVTADQAAVETAAINLGYTRIVAPVGGRVGLRQVDIGNMLTAGQTNGVAVITQEQPMSVLFSVPEDNIDAIMARVSAGAKLRVEAYDRSQTDKIATGTLATVDNTVDVTTGTVKMRALFSNSHHELFPNQFVNVHLLVNTLHNQIVVPASAIQHGSEGDFVFVVNPDKTADQRIVTVGPQDGTNIDILKGIRPGDTVVVDGGDRLRDGAQVTIPDLKAQTIAPPSQVGADPQAEQRAAQRVRAQAAMRKACAGDIKKFCGGQAQGRALFICLREHKSDLSSVCKAAQDKMRSRRPGGGFGGRP